MIKKVSLLFTLLSLGLFVASCGSATTPAIPTKTEKPPTRLIPPTPVVWPVFSPKSNCTENELRCVENYNDCANNPDHKDDPKFALTCYSQQYSDLAKTTHCPFIVPSCN